MAEMNLHKVRIAYNGEALENYSMDINDLAPALMAFGQLVMRANEVIGNKQQVRVMLTADSLRRGSFDVSLELVYTGLEQMKALVGFADDSGISALMEVLGWGGTITGLTIGVWELIKKIGSKKVKAVKSEDGKVIITLENNTTVVTTQNTFNVYMDMQVRESVNKVVAPLSKDGIDSFELRNPNDYTDNKCISSVHKNELSLYDVPELEVRVEPDNVFEQEMLLKIVSIVFDESQKWRFSDGEVTFWAKVEDDAFWHDVESGALAFRSGDRLKAMCKTVQRINQQGNFVTERTIVKVIKVLPKPTQIRLDFAE